jgi:hypothetical protein
MKLVVAFFLTAGVSICAQANTAQTAPDLDLNLSYYSKVLTPEGVTREARYQEKMLRRPGHVWVARILPTAAISAHVHDSNQPAAESEHKLFNHVVLPRHVVLQKNKLRVEYVDAKNQDLIAIPLSEYGNVNFDGSWKSSFYLVDPALVKAMPLSARLSPVPGAQWHEREQNGVYQRILWNSEKQIPLIIESGDTAATFYRRIDIKAMASLSRDLPWRQLKGYAQKEYSDFLD